MESGGWSLFINFPFFSDPTRVCLCACAVCAHRLLPLCFLGETTGRTDTGKKGGRWRIKWRWSGVTLPARARKPTFPSRPPTGPPAIIISSPSPTQADAKQVGRRELECCQIIRPRSVMGYPRHSHSSFYHDSNRTRSHGCLIGFPLFTKAAGRALRVKKVGLIGFSLFTKAAGRALRVKKVG